MNRSLIWKGLYYDSIESCIVDVSEKEIVIKSTIIGSHNSIRVTADYQIKTTPYWIVKSFEINYSFNKINRKISGVRSNAEWIIDGQAHNEFKNCVDIDITLTPFTNSLPINRLNLSIDQSKQIDVVYINILEDKLYPVKQQYAKKSLTQYNFQNVPNDFEADITVDKEGFVAHYPELFERADN